MADNDAIAAAIAKVKSKKAKKPKTGKGGNGDGAQGNGKSSLNRVNGAGTSKRPGHGGAARANFATPGVSVVQHKQGTPKQRVVPTGQKLKYVFDLAKANRMPLKYEMFKQERDVDIDGALLDALRKHQLLSVDEVAGTVTYLPKYQIANKDELHKLIKKHPFGLLSTELADAYADARQHLDELYEDASVFEVGSAERPSTVIYPNFYKPPGGLPDDSVRDALFDIQLPQREEEADEALKAARIQKAKRSTPRLKMAVIHDDRKPIKQKRQTRLRKVTNTHMEHLFTDDMPGTIDG